MIYSILKGRVVEAKPFSQKDATRPHYHLHIDAGGRNFDVAINIRSEMTKDDEGNPLDVRVLYAIKDASGLPTLPRLARMVDGIINLEEGDEAGLDYVAQNLVTKGEMSPLPLFRPDGGGTDAIMDFVQAGMDAEATFIAFGHRYEPSNKFDPAWDFRPDDGVHNIHMNQGNEGGHSFSNENGRYVDGGLLILFPDGPKMAYIAFQTQSWNNDDRGQPIGASAVVNS
ncbi:MAG TPA: DUF2278 family protein [Fimbriimonadaceae bacterium]|nr:DUF2278 family protein [Fimbriimonadaceae bacterium]